MCRVTGTLVILRHGESTWNQLNLFTGWHDVPLNEKGLAEGAAAGQTMAEAGLRFDVAHTSVLTRAVVTHHLALDEMGQVWLPVQRHWRLNERHYGALQGLDKKETTERHGAEQTKLWRRSYDVPPPPVDTDSPEHPINDRPLPTAPARRAARHRVPEGCRRPCAPLLARRRRAAVARRAERLDHRARQLAARAGDAPRRSVDRRHRRAQHPHRRAASIRVRRRHCEFGRRQYLGDADAVAAAAAKVAAQAGG